MTSSTELAPVRRHPWLAWRQWRKGRPFWGGLISVAAGAEICAIPLGPVKVMLMQGITGVLSILMGLVMIMLGLSAWFAPLYRMFAGIVTVMCAAAALVLSNLGGFLFGTLLGVLGGSMIFAWQPLPSAEPDTTADTGLDAVPPEPPDRPSGPAGSEGFAGAEGPVPGLMANESEAAPGPAPVHQHPHEHLPPKESP